VVKLPPDADPSELMGAPPLGRRSEVAAALLEVLEGLGLNPEGRGRFERPGCVIDVDTGPDDLVSLVTLGVQGGEVAQRAVRALSQKTGWRVIDRSADKLFDMPGGASPVPRSPRPKPAPTTQPTTAPAPQTAKVPAPTPQSKPTGTGQTVRLHKDQITGAGRAGRSPRRVAFAALGVTLLGAAVFVGVQTQLASRSSEANEALALVDVLEFARAQETFGAANLGAYAPPEVLGDPSRYATLLSTGAPLEALGGNRFAEQVRHGYRFEFRPDPGSAREDAPVTPAFESFAYLALPVAQGSGQRSFAYFSRPGRTIVAREDGQAPTRRDTPVARVP
jgi:hypothetical protein